MESKKNVAIFKPMSQTLEKLVEVLRENIETENIEIYEMENMAEAAQTIPNLEPVLVLGSEPKVVAQFLKANRKYIKNSKNRILLISGKKLNNKAQQKLTKLGLTDLIFEPLAPKTLLY